MSLPPRKRSFQRGQGMLEYALIVFLVPVILTALSGALPAL
jgi:hypothetical protein